MGFICLKAIQPLEEALYFFTTKLSSILSFPKKLVSAIF